MIQRIKSLISVKNLSASQFADLLGVQRSNISHILSGRNKPSLDFILKITEHFPSVSTEWLLKGKGEMFYLEEKREDSPPIQLDIPVEDAIFEKEAVTEKPTDLQSGKKDTSDEIETSAIKQESHREQNKKANPKADELSTITEEDEVEQVMVLYKNGSFKVYTPRN